MLHVSNCVDNSCCCCTVSDMASAEDRFQRAAERMRLNKSLKLGNEQKLQLYGLFKQVSVGVCNTSKPAFFDFTGRAKWEAWNSLGQMTKTVAIDKYLDLVSILDPDWEKSSSLSEEGSGSLDAGSGGTGGGGGGGGRVVSTLAGEVEEAITDSQKTLFDWCKESNIERLAAMVTADNVDLKDEQGMCLLHWASDRGSLEVVKLLADKGADLNALDSDLQTSLHYAATCDQADIVAFLLSAGADKSIKDCDGNLPEEVTSNPATKLLFQS